jgi:hypothetical protein
MMRVCGEFKMRLALGFYLFILCGWLTVGTQVMPASDGSCSAVSSGMVSHDWLSTASEPANENAALADHRKDIETQIDETENALNCMKRPLDAEEQETAAQIRTYITIAREALKYDDLDGARTISAKGHALLLGLPKALWTRPMPSQRSPRRGGIAPLHRASDG